MKYLIIYIFCSVISLMLFFIAVDAEYKRVCYYSNWSQYRPGRGSFKPKDINPSLCTHLVYAFARLSGNGLATLEWNDAQFYKTFNGLKTTYPSLRTLIAVGGWNEGSLRFSTIVSLAENRREFASNTVQFIRQYGFDGFDIDWEYPVSRGGSLSDYQNFILLLQELQQMFEEEAVRTGKERLLLTAAVAAGKNTIDVSYDIPGMTRYLDFISLMSYDFHGSWEKTTGHNSPLYKRSGEQGDLAYLNVQAAANYWITKGCPSKKLIIGLPTYGRSFTLADPNKWGMGEPASGVGPAGSFTREAGVLSYYEICEIMASGRGKRYWNSEQMVPYYVQGTTWVGYDDKESFTIKLKWIKESGYGGAMIWNLDLDDFNGSFCAGPPFPLTRLLNVYLMDDSRSTTTLKTTRTRIPKTSHFTTRRTTDPRKNITTTTTQANAGFCRGKSDGLHPDLRNCTHFYNCFQGRGSRITCPTGTLFNRDRSYCDWPYNVKC
ncbi:hypothetical protein CHS0354_015910 [Potamilus streckersoni]|uniref:Chitinase n=1 Tax=Potamilus streckersoni TaxID=2493646 RepID=A0AAE0SDG2_9BIVA|nr:hypothetical protein CHS0354_015910 [Potamilus streckersoni]